jgi:hypothetical protein
LTATAHDLGAVNMGAPVHNEHAVAGILSALLFASCSTELKTARVVLDGDVPYAVALPFRSRSHARA